ncbi:hypothetical protein Bpfe_030453 [Biomphalaria pfeifferi]|uniref:Uncharacterized protein n=1 Tax=Biomphalaria pfeifferi TaxID=112525 RepID=A0AAD8APQ8_BIOPF|nr:hypothetical protein Bpfe_030453 [Biomphalaria pfeifferi]
MSGQLTSVRYMVHLVTRLFNALALYEGQSVDGTFLLLQCSVWITQFKQPDQLELLQIHYRTFPSLLNCQRSAMVMKVAFLLASCLLFESLTTVSGYEEDKCYGPAYPEDGYEVQTTFSPVDGVDPAPYVQEAAFGRRD